MPPIPTMVNVYVYEYFLGGADRGLRSLLKVSCKTKWPAAAIIFLAQFLVFALFYLS